MEKKGKNTGENSKTLGPTKTQNLVVKFDGEICGGVLVENASDDFPSKRSSKISFQTSPEVRHQFRRKLRQLHSGNRWCLKHVQCMEKTFREIADFCPFPEGQLFIRSYLLWRDRICRMAVAMCDLNKANNAMLRQR